MQVLDAVIKGILLGMFMAISVGPTLFAVIKYSLQYSYKAGLAFVLGVSVSDIIYVAIANVAAGWLIILENYKTGIALGGGGILFFAGLIGIVKRTNNNNNVNVDTIKISGRHFLQIWTSGFLINTINPGVFISWLAAVTATANSSTGYRFTLFGTCLALILSIDFMKVFLAEKIRKKLTPKLVGVLHKLSSSILMILGIILIITTIRGK